jgi:putative nucleotidyltransferase with HDIG domain
MDNTENINSFEDHDQEISLEDQSENTSFEDVELSSFDDSEETLDAEKVKDDDPDKYFTELESQKQYIEELESSLEHISEIAAKNFYQTIQVMADIVSLNERRFYEGSHSRFVAHWSAEVAHQLGMPQTEVFEIRTAGLLHDIGKIGYDGRMLGKFTAEMTPAELDIYKNHANLGYQILKQHPSFENISKIIYQHHERLDGSGFPHKLKGKEILPGAAIVAVVDMFHNLVFKRPKKLLDKNYNAQQYLKSRENRLTNSIEYLNVKASTLYDTRVVEVFCENARKEWGELIKKTVWRIQINKVEIGMIIAEDYFNRAGLLIAAKGEHITKGMKKLLIRFAEVGEIPKKILVMK